MKFNLMFEPVDKKDPEAFMVEKTEDGYKVKYIAIDNDPESPRVCDNFCTMVCFHKKYVLGDEEHGYKAEKFYSWDDLKESIEKIEDVAVILPLYLYDHSGLSIRTTPFEDKWDSGQIGYIFVTKAKICEEFSITDEEITEEIVDKAKKILEGEVQIYDNYLNGNVYRLVEEIFDNDKQQIDNSIVGGFYDMEYAKKELKTFQT